MRRTMVFIVAFIWISNNTWSQLAVFENEVVIGTDQIDPDVKLQVDGTTRINTNTGALDLGFPENGNQWRFNTSGGGATLRLLSKPNGSSTYSKRLHIDQNGATSFGNHIPEAWVHLRNNSTIGMPHLKLEESGVDFARLEMKTQSTDSYWQMAGKSNLDEGESRINFYYNDGSEGSNLMTILGNGNVGINNTSPNAKLQINHLEADRGLTMINSTFGKGYELRYSNFPKREGFDFWEIGVSRTARVHIEWGTGNYSSLSDRRAKKNIRESENLLTKILDLTPKTYQYKGENDRRYYGFIAQDLQEGFPDLITEIEQPDGTTSLLVDNSQMAAIALTAAQQQQVIIDELQLKTEMLEDRIAFLEDAMLSMMANK